MLSETALANFYKEVVVEKEERGKRRGLLSYLRERIGAIRPLIMIVDCYAGIIKGIRMRKEREEGWTDEWMKERKEGRKQ